MWSVPCWTRYLHITKLVSYWRWCFSGPCWTACTHSVWLWVHLAAVEKLGRPLGNWNVITTSRRHLGRFATWTFHELQRFTCDMYAPSSNICQVNKLCCELSLLKGVKLILVNFLPVKTAFWCMLNSQTARLHFGGAAFNVPPTCHILFLSWVDCQMNSWKTTGFLDYQHHWL